MTSPSPPVLLSNPRIEAVLSALLAKPEWERRRFVRKQRYPRYLYKYRSLDPHDPDSVLRFRNIVLGSRLWLSSPLDFNDPFDMGARITVAGPRAQKRDRMKELVQRHSTLPTRKQRRQQAAALAKRPPSSLIRNVTVAHERAIRETGVCALAGDPRSILMWSHYSANHEGLCLQFDVARDPRVFLRALSVEYSEDYPVINWLDNTADQLKIALLRKYQAWNYEQEHRIIVQQSARSSLPFNESALTATIVGCRASDGVKEQLASILAERSARGLPEVRVYEATKHSAKFALMIKRTAL